MIRMSAAALSTTTIRVEQVRGVTWVGIADSPEDFLISLCPLMAEGEGFE
jgi:hypothetical protein